MARAFDEFSTRPSWISEVGFLKLATLMDDMCFHEEHWSHSFGNIKLWLGFGGAGLGFLP
jgi:hypothetical protein